MNPSMARPVPTYSAPRNQIAAWLVRVDSLKPVISTRPKSASPSGGAAGLCIFARVAVVFTLSVSEKSSAHARRSGIAEPLRTLHDGLAQARSVADLER